MCDGEVEVLSCRNKIINVYIYIHIVGRDSSVGSNRTARGLNPSGGEIFHTCPDRP
jgi:hypothetical protein